MAGDLLLEEVKAALDFVPRAQVRAGVLSANRREHQLVRDALDDRRARVRFAVAEEAVAYNADRLDDAHRGAQWLLGEVGLGEVEWLAETVRAVAINSGLVGDATALGQAWSRFRDVEGDLPDGTWGRTPLRPLSARVGAFCVVTPPTSGRDGRSMP